ncbi:DUF2062 domain-containing protein [Leptospira fletcheri]|uniref:DUF2062 domain-containing protein n=1 Tax=Leptospira fletcheri TaxID=2484981 RepID=A0A4R9GBD8_9LEPT|nr:DUF2062 domain-containing protein [Leptospira fletcheri]TGK09014.1 DUF2062 domain-containing protein [Leptospira fletcheri]
MSTNEKRKTPVKPSFVGKLKEAIVKELKTGISPEKIALSLVLGGAIGVFPLIGTTMALAAVFGFLLRLNPISVQLANYAMYPLQIFLLIPFLEFGARLSGTRPDLEWAYRFVDGDPSLLWKGLVDSALYAVVGWGSTVPALSFATYFVVLPLVKKIDRIVRKDSL